MAKTPQQIIEEAKARRASMPPPAEQGQRFVGPVGMVPQGPLTQQSIIQAALNRRLATAQPEIPAQNLSYRQRLAEMQRLESEAGRGLAETITTMGSGAIAEPVAGYAGIVTAPFLGAGRATENIEATRQALTYQPRSEAGRQVLTGLGQTIEPIAAPLQQASQYLGEKGYEIGGPVGGAIGKTLLPAAAEAVGLIGVNAGRTVARANINPEARQIIEAGAARNVPVRTSDVLPPKNFASRWMQSIYEKIPIIGGAPQRQAQQLARQEAVKGLADEFGLELESIGDLSINLVNSISQQNAATLTRAGTQRLQALQALDPIGAVPMVRTLSTIDELMRQQLSLGQRADTALIQKLSDIRESLAVDPVTQQTWRNFSGTKDIRTTVIDDLKAINRSDDPRSFAPLQQVKSAMDKDMVAFARQSDPQAAKNWLQSNRIFARELESVRRTELRRAFNSGNTTPEVVLPILRGGKRSELQRLNSALTPSGKRSARAAIIYDALAESGYFGDPANANPDRLANALKRQNRMQAVDVFFTGRDKDALTGFSRLLDATRRAQQAGVVTPTGQQLVPFAVAGGAYAAPITAAIATASLSSIGRFYESAGMRNFLLKLNSTKPGSRLEASMIEAAVPALTAALKTLESQNTSEE